jgi:hypothetical protein
MPDPGGLTTHLCMNEGEATKGAIVEAGAVLCPRDAVRDPSLVGTRPEAQDSAPHRTPGRRYVKGGLRRAGRAKAGYLTEKSPSFAVGLC